jgi:hypothetical protein
VLPYRNIGPRQRLSRKIVNGYDRKVILFANPSRNAWAPKGLRGRQGPTRVAATRDRSTKCLAGFLLIGVLCWLPSFVQIASAARTIGICVINLFGQVDLPFRISKNCACRRLLSHTTTFGGSPAVETFSRNVILRLSGHLGFVTEMTISYRGEPSILENLRSRLPSNRHASFLTSIPTTVAADI